MQEYVIARVEPFGGELARRKIHREVSGCRCRILKLEIGRAAEFYFTPLDDTGGNWLWFHTSAVTGIEVGKDGSVEINTLNTLYRLELIK